MTARGRVDLGEAVITASAGSPLSAGRPGLAAIIGAGILAVIRALDQ